ncbi:MAG: hypothetical protein C4523_01275 [Myxococcales bacterium]|nr:MAG: hypothetical protein C4523_01275 [Myxococcales bacterium]
MAGRLILAALAAFLRALSLKQAQSLGRWLGRLVYYFLPIRRQTVVRQLGESLGDAHSPTEIRRLARGVYEHLGMNLVEFLRLDASRPETLPPIRIDGLERIRKAAEQGRGVLALTAHFGNWDLLCCSQSLAGWRLAILSKTVKPAWLNNYWMTSRERFGLRILPGRGVKVDLLAHLAAGGVVGFVLDQHHRGPGAAAVEFFGKPAWTTTGLAALALDSGAPVVPVFIHREADGSHVLEVGESVETIGADSREATLAALTARYVTEVERAVRRHPEQWLWLHRRWKNGAMVVDS